MKHFIDFEFLEDGETIVPISIGIASEDFVEYYAVFSEIQTDEGLHQRISGHDFLAKHVIKHLPLVNDGAVAKQLTRAMSSQADDPYFRPNSNKYSRDSKGLDWELDLTDPDVKPKWVIANEVRKYFLDRPDHAVSDPGRDDEGDVELWANYGAYDHVCLMQLWGPMVKRPSHLPMFTHDLQQYARFLGVDPKTFPKQEAAEHDALADARHDWDIWKYLEAQRIEQLKAAD
jgi:hypothetical protein